MFPKDPPVVDRAFLAWIKVVLGRCEWPGCRAGARDGLEAAHVRARGMGGGRRKDTPENVAVLCPRHHRAFDGGGQSPEAQEALREAVRGGRSPWEVAVLEAGPAAAVEGPYEVPDPASLIGDGPDDVPI